MFRGVTNLTLDKKGRVVMPSRYRERLQERCGGKLIVTADVDLCLLIYPLQDWEEIEHRLQRLPNLDPQVRKFQRLTVGHASEVELDGQGRVLLPPNLRTYAALDRDAVLVGQFTHFELWDETRWKEAMEGGEPTTLSTVLQNVSL
jgi:MraZ protein